MVYHVILNALVEFNIVWNYLVFEDFVLWLELRDWVVLLSFTQGRWNFILSQLNMHKLQIIGYFLCFILKFLYLARILHFKIEILIEFVHILKVDIKHLLVKNSCFWYVNLKLTSESFIEFDYVGQLLGDCLKKLLYFHVFRFYFEDLRFYWD